ncbi:MAG TPA: M14 family metallopeptidase [Vicinamibacterales bacterium]|nr:M14 family metallopeptidase [Vicinamibacterales bacterium]
MSAAWLRRGAAGGALAVAAIGANVWAAAGSSSHAAAAAAPSLATIWSDGGLVEDTNGDKVPDAVAATIVLPDTPSTDDVAAAADVAARLGHETLAMDLPMKRNAESGPAIAIGPQAAARLGATPPALTLKTSEGAVAVTAVNGRTIVMLLGADGAGTRAAALAFAGVLPSAGDPKGPTLSDVSKDLRGVLETAKTPPSGIDIDYVVAVAGAEGLDRIHLTAKLPNRSAAASAAKALSLLRPAAADKPQLSYKGTRSLAIDVVAERGTATTITLDRVKGEDDAEPPPRRPGAAAKDSLDLSSLYANEGLLGDGDSNLIPDRVDAVLSPSDASAGTIDVAARLGLESTGVSIPLVLPADRVGKPESQPTLVLIGKNHPLVRKLQDSGKYTPPQLSAGEGAIDVVKKAFGEKPAVIVIGADGPGLDRALAQLAERFPHIWDRGKDRTTLDDVEEDARRFLGGRTPAGQAALALYKIRQLGTELHGQQIASANVQVSVEKAAPGLDALLKRESASAFRTNAVDLSVENRDVQHAKTIFTDDFEIPSEVDALRALVRQKVIPAIASHKKQPVALEARVSESPELRHQLQAEIRDQLVKAGAGNADVTVLSAYKQGFSWLDEVVKPAITGKQIDRITIRFAKATPPKEWEQQTTYAPTRWLLELYPIAEILQRDLKLPADKVVFEEAPAGAPTYDVTVAGSGGTIFHGTFEPRFVIRQFFDQFPDYEKVRVTTGWLTAKVGSDTVADERVETDIEKFWDRFQSKTLRDVYAYMMRVHDGKPRAEDAPFFGELKVDLSLSEPDYTLGIDQEQIASLESVQEEVYFNTLHFFDLLGRYTRSADLAYPGRVIPVVHPKNDGRAGHASISFTGFEAPRPQVRVEYTLADGTKGTVERDIPKITVDRPEALRAVVRQGDNGLERLGLRVKVDSQHDERADLVKKYRQDQVDRQMISADQVRAVFENLSALRAAGLYRDALAYHDLKDLSIDAGWTFDVDPKQTVTAPLAANGQPEPWPDIRKLLPPGYKYHGERLVQWDEPISPDEANELLAKMSTFKEATVYKVGESYLGRDIWAMDLMPPITASHWSQAKATTLKPTVIYSARQHANEVSSTSHTLRLAELLLTDPVYRAKLNVANTVFHPITNPDGAQLAYDLQKITPRYMLHPGYLGSLGVDATSGGFDPDPIYPESKVRPEIWRMWLPDIFLNPHGYPTHEWVQVFSEYAAWIRNRIGESRDYWTMRGWWMPGFGFVDDPKFPRNKAAQESLRRFITERINAAPEVKALNTRSYERYQRYTTAFDPNLFKVNFTNDVLIYSSMKGQKRSASSQSFMVRQPNITIFDGSTEAPDETAHGDWMKLVATAGLTWDQAMLDWLIAQPHHVDRTGSVFAGGVALTMDRPRPPKPAKDKKADEATTPVAKHH